jgi:hypothetical protein
MIGSARNMETMGVSFMEALRGNEKCGLQIKVHRSSRKGKNREPGESQAAGFPR